jgi:hypothetical protein
MTQFRRRKRVDDHQAGQRTRFHAFLSAPLRNLKSRKIRLFARGTALKVEFSTFANCSISTPKTRGGPPGGPTDEIPRVSKRANAEFKNSKNSTFSARGPRTAENSTFANRSIKRRNVVGDSLTRHTNRFRAFLTTQLRNLKSRKIRVFCLRPVGGRKFDFRKSLN